MISFVSLGTLENPKLMNIDTGEEFRLLKTMTAGEEFLVYTHFAVKKVVQIMNNTEQTRSQR